MRNFLFNIKDCETLYRAVDVGRNTYRITWVDNDEVKSCLYKKQDIEQFLDDEIWEKI